MEGIQFHQYFSVFRLKNDKYSILPYHSEFYPPKGAANADPEWGPMDFTYVLIILSCVLQTYLGVSKCGLLSAFWKFWKCFIVTGGNILPPSIFFIFKYNNKQLEFFPKMCLKVASAN